MKNYLELFNSIEDVFTEIKKDASEKLIGISIKNGKYGDGVITKITEVNKTYTGLCDIVAEIKFGEDTKQFYLLTSINNGATVVDEDIKNFLVELSNDEIPVFEEVARLAKIASEEETKRIQAAREQKLKEEKEKKLAIKRENLKKQQYEIVSKLKAHKANLNDNYYTGLGYIAKHARRIVAEMPDYLEDWFIKTFGNQEHKAYDQSILCPSGLPSHYALGFRIDLDTNENMPSVLVSHLSSQDKTNKPIADTQFIYEIMYNYGFQFGKTQDLDKILDSIPSDQLDNFRLGLNA